MRNRFRKATALVVAATLALSGCANVQQGMSGLGQQNMVLSCAEFAAGAGLVMEMIDKAKKTPSTGAAHRNKLVKAAAVGCAIGMAATAVGRLLDARQQAQYEEAAQRTAKRQAQETANYTAITRRYDAMPAPRTPKEKDDREKRRQDELDKSKDRLTKPETVELAGGGTTTITPGTPDTATPETQGCFTQTVLVSKPGGQAKQVDTMCPNGKGGFARVESAEASFTG